jgi:hypothetical protein
METYSISLYQTEPHHVAIHEFEEALRYSTLCYTMRHLQLAGAGLQQDLQQALQSAIQVCKLAGINSTEHFKPIYVGDSANGTIYMDLLMSKKAFSLMMMHLPVNEQTARWLWELVSD